MSRVTFFVFKDLKGPLRDVSDKPRFKTRPSGSKGIGGEMAFRPGFRRPGRSKAGPEAEVKPNRLTDYFVV